VIWRIKINKYNNLIEVIFTEEFEFLRVFELSNFLYHLKIIYSWLTISEEFQECRESRSYEEIKRNANNIVQIVLEKRERRPYSTFYNYYNFFRKDLKGKDIFIAKIHKESPLTIWFMGISTILVAAFILSGGELEISIAPPRIKIKMGSLGEGIRKLKEVMKR